MECARVITSVREGMVPFQVEGWGMNYRKLFAQTDLSGYEVWLTFSSNNFNNPFAKSDEERYAERGEWEELFRDKVQGNGEGERDGKFSIRYTSHTNTKWERVDDLWMPKTGWYVPTDDGIFHEGTLIPFETIQDKQLAMKRLESKGIPREQVAYFYIFPNLLKDGNAYIVSRHVNPVKEYGWFAVSQVWPDANAFYMRGSRHSYTADIAMEVNIRK